MLRRIPFPKTRLCFMPILPKEIRNSLTKLKLENLRLILECKTDPVRVKRGFEEGLVKDKSTFFCWQCSLIKVLYLRGDKLLAQHPFYKQQGSSFLAPFNWTGSLFPLLITVATKTTICHENITVRAEIITELIPERAGPVIFKNFFTGINSFQTDSSNLSFQKSKAWKSLETIINSKRGLSRKKNQ